MSTKRSKRYNEAAKLVDNSKAYSVEEAVEVMKSFPAPKFDPTVTVSFRLTVDPRKSDQMVRGSVALPHGTGKNVRVIVFAQGEAAQAALDAGAEKVGLDDLIKEIQGGFLDFDSAIATPDAMAQVRKIARVLGPRGLMPNPKTGTVTEDTAKAVREVKAGRVDFKVDRNANISAAVGKLSFESDKLVENARALISAVVKARPSGAKGAYIAGVTMASSMNPGLSVAQVEYSKN
ncbi:MAG: 50S ribosomal protein L1 [Akkermansia sp.]|nr:50S ribosomal protein L1 [Akkermansia sp.]